MKVTVDALEALVTARASVLAEIDDAQRRLHSIGQAIEAYMAEQRAEERTAAGYRVLYKRPVVWNRDALVPLLEAIPEEQLVEAGAYVAEHQRTVPAAFNLVKLKPLARYSEDARRIIESAQSLGLAELKIEKEKP